MAKEITGTRASSFLTQMNPVTGAIPIGPRYQELIRYEGQRRVRVEVLRQTMTGWPFRRENPPILELGCGHGHFLSAYAAARPDSTCWGIDFCRDRIRRAVRKQQRLALPNLVFLRAEVGEFLDALPSEVRFADVFVLFPEPWPKRRHKKNRLVSEAFLARLAGLEPAGGRLFFRSDNNDYFEEVLALLERSHDWSVEGGAKWDFDCATVFQEKAPAYSSLCAIRLG